MGNLRFTVGAIQQIVQGSRHHARIAVLPYEDAQAAVQHSKATSGVLAHSVCISVTHILADCDCFVVSVRLC